MSYINMMTKPCRVCGNASIVQVWEHDLERYYNGALIQDAFPDLKDEVRETIKTGYHPECWAKALGTNDDE